MFFTASRSKELSKRLRRGGQGFRLQIRDSVLLAASRCGFVVFSNIFGVPRDWLCGISQRGGDNCVIYFRKRITWWVNLLAVFTGEHYAHFDSPFGPVFYLP